MPKAVIPSVNPDEIPAELRELPRWDCWQERANPGGGKPGKPPIQANVKFSGRHVYAKANDPATWASFDEAVRYWRDHLRGKEPASGLSFALNGDGIVGIDLDGCLDPATKRIDEWAVKIIKRFRTYTEVSPSRSGLRLFLRGKLPPAGRHKGKIEVYDRDKFLSVTGRRLTGHGASVRIEDRSAELLVWHREVFTTAPTSPKEKRGNDQLVIHDPPHLDQARLNRLFQGKPKAKAVFDGKHGYASQSEADLALANYATAAGWNAQQTLDLLVAARHNAGAPAKPVAYFERTIAEVRDGNNFALGDGKWSSLTESLARIPRGTDEITIGGDHGKEIAPAGSMADVAKLIEGVKFLLRGWVPFGMVTMLVGEPGAGKSAFALYGLARPIITARPWFNGMKGPTKPGNVLWCDCEGTAALTIQRIKDWGLPAERIKVLSQDDPLLSVNLESDEHLERIEALIGKHRIKLVVIDSLRGAHGGNENDSRVANVVQRLAKIAERTRAATVIIHHTRKLAEGEDMTANASRGEQRDCRNGTQSTRDRPARSAKRFVPAADAKGKPWPETQAHRFSRHGQGPGVWRSPTKAEEGNTRGKRGRVAQEQHASRQMVSGRRTA